MAAVQETENLGKAAATSVVALRAANQGVKPISLRIAGASYTNIPNRVRGVRRIGLNTVEAT